MFRIPQLYSISELAVGGKLNRVNDTVAGGSQPLGSVVPGGGTVNSQNLRAGQQGFTVELNAEQALALSDTTIGTLFAGWYMYVQTLVASVRGGVAFISSLANGGNYIVTSDSSVAANLLRPVGVFLNVVSANQFGWIQLAGLATLKFATDVTDPVDGQLVKVVDQAGTGVGQQVAADLLGTTPSTAALISAYVRTGMVAAELPVDNTLTRVFMLPSALLI